MRKQNNRKNGNEYRILFTGVGRRVELIQAFRQAATVLDKILIIYGADITYDAPALAYCDYTRKVCGMRDVGYIGELLEICREDQIDLLIPTIDTDLLVLAKNKEKFEKVGTKVLICRQDKIMICRDKNNISQFFVDCGCKAPMPVNDWRKYESAYPAFIKPKDGSSSINAFKVGNKEELEVYATHIKDYIVQPFVEGTEYTVDVFCDFNGNPIYITPRIRIQVRAGEVLKTKIDLDEKIINECKCIIKRFYPVGPITIQLIRERKTGDDYYIEINPRFGGGAPLSMKAGARSAEATLQLLSDEKLTAHSVSDGKIYSRFDQSICVLEYGRNQMTKGIIFDLDDTLYSEKEYIKSGHRAIAKYLKVDDAEAELWNYFENGKPAIDCYLKKNGMINEKENCIRIYREHMPDIHLYEGVEKLIRELQNKGIRVGIITDGRINGQRNKIKALGLDKFIRKSDIIITDELGGKQFRKPCDIAFRIMVLRWKLPVEEIIYVGDNVKKDSQAPQRIGMRYLYFRNSDGLYDFPIANMMCAKSIKEIRNFLIHGGVFFK